MFAILAPGQGAQSPGFLTTWLDIPSVAARLRWWSAVTDLDLVELGTTADADRIRDTAITQPLLVAAGLVAAQQLFERPVAGGVAAGHSIGEVTAAAAAGAISAESALVLARERGRAMATAAARTPTGMTAILGGEPADVDARLDELGLVAANRNGAGQVVAAGTATALAELSARPPERARLRPLSVAGAFHTEHMAPARDRLATLVPGIPVRDPQRRLISNADGAVITDGRGFVDRLVAQVAAPVRWDRCMDSLRDLGVTAAVELPPAGTLTGLLRRELPDVEVIALKTPADLPAARALLAANRTPQPGYAPAWRLVVAPLGGRFRREPISTGDHIDSGTALGIVVSSRMERKVEATYGGVLVEWLVEDDDPVSAGQPLARLHPDMVPA